MAYRLAPEHPHPAPVDDVHAGLLWTVEHAAELGIDPARIIAMGTSAGGGLTAALALRLRDTGGPRLLGQLLMCPMLDDRNNSFSVRQMAGRIWQSGGQADLHVWDGGSHVFDWIAPDARISRAARAARTGWLDRVLATGSSGAGG